MDSKPKSSKTHKNKENIPAQNLTEKGFANPPPTSNSKGPPKVPKRRKARASKAVGTADTQVVRDANVPGPPSKQRMAYPVTDPGNNVKISMERRYTEHAKLEQLARQNDLLLSDGNILQPSSNQGVHYKTTDERKVLTSNSRRVEQAEGASKQSARIVKNENKPGAYITQEVFRRVAQASEAEIEGTSEASELAQEALRQIIQIVRERKAEAQKPQVPSTNGTAEDAQNALGETSHIVKDGNASRPHSTEEVPRSVAEAQKPQIPSTTGTVKKAQKASRQTFQKVRDGNVSPPHSTQEVPHSVAETQKPQVTSTSGTAENAQNALRQTSHIVRDENVSRPHSIQEASRGVAEAQGPKVTSTGGTVKKTQNAARPTSQIVRDWNASQPHRTQEASRGAAEAQRPQVTSTGGTVKKAQNAARPTSQIVRDWNASRPHRTQEDSRGVAEAKRPQVTSTCGTVKKTRNGTRPTSQIVRDWNTSRAHRTQELLRSFAEAWNSQIPSPSGTVKKVQSASRQTFHMVRDGNVSRPHRTQEAHQNVAEAQKPQMPSPSATAKKAQNVQREPRYEIAGIRIDADGAPYIKVIKKRFELLPVYEVINGVRRPTNLKKVVQRNEAHGIPFRCLRGGNSLLFKPEELKKKIAFCNYLMNGRMNERPRIHHIIEEAKAIINRKKNPRVQVNDTDSDDVSSHNTIINDNSVDQTTVNRDPFDDSNDEYKDVDPHEDIDASLIFRGNPDIDPNGILTINDNSDPEDAPGDTNGPSDDSYSSFEDLDPYDQLTFDDDPDSYKTPICLSDADDN